MTMQLTGLGVVAPQNKPSKTEIANAVKNELKVQEAKAKPKEERTLNDKIVIATNTVNKIIANTPVKHANGVGDKLDATV